MSAYTQYITATKNGNNIAYFSGYYTNPILFRIGLTFTQSLNSESVKAIFKHKQGSE